MPTALVPIAEGCEEIEAVIIIDTLRRAGWTVVSAGLEEGPVTCSRGVRIVPDARWSDVDVSACDLLVLPGGGPGTEALRRDPRVLEAIRVFDAQQKTIAAVCAAPLVLQEAGILDGREVTCHPSVADNLTVGRHVDRAVVADGNLVTSQGPGTAFAFALTLIARVDGEDKAEAIRRAMVLALP